MNESLSQSDVDAFLAEMGARDVRRHEQIEAGIGHNKAALFDALAAAGITSVIVTFDGSGDEGQIESIDARGDSGAIDLPEVSVEIMVPTRDRSGLEQRAMPLGEAIEEILYELLRDTHPGWENNDGAFGEFAFDVARRTITHEHHSRYTEIDSSVHEW